MTLAMAWTQDVRTDLEKKKAREDAVRNSTIALSRLRQIIQQQITVLQKQTLQKPGTADYATSQAFFNGGITELNGILDLLKFLKEPK